jgi:hypothetical protein
MDSTTARIPSKQNQIKPSKKPWISLVLFVRIGTFQWVASEKIKKIDSRLKLRPKRLKHLPFLSRQGPVAWQGVGSIGGRVCHPKDHSAGFRFSQENVA